MACNTLQPRLTVEIAHFNTLQSSHTWQWQVLFGHRVPQGTQRIDEAEPGTDNTILCLCYPRLKGRCPANIRRATSSNLHRHFHRKQKHKRQEGCWWNFRIITPHYFTLQFFFSDSFCSLKCNHKMDVESEISSACQLEGNWLHTLWWYMGLTVCKSVTNNKKTLQKCR